MRVYPCCNRDLRLVFYNFELPQKAYDYEDSIQFLKILDYLDIHKLYLYHPEFGKFFDFKLGSFNRNSIRHEGNLFVSQGPYSDF